MGRRQAARNAYTHHIGLAKYCDNPWFSGERRATVILSPNFRLSSRLQLLKIAPQRVSLSVFIIDDFERYCERQTSTAPEDSVHS